MTEDLDQLRSDLALLRAEVMQLRTERGAAMPFDFARVDDGILAQRAEQPSIVRIHHALDVIRSGDLTATITPGEVELGPATRLTWDGKRLINGTENAGSGCLTNHLTGGTTITVLTGNTAWHVWANVNIVEGAESWEIFEGATVTPLVDSETPGAEIKVIRQKIIAVLTITDDVITGVENKTCGNIDIPRL